MGYLDDTYKKTVNTANTVAEAPAQKVADVTGTHWNPVKTIDQSLQDPTNKNTGVNGALGNAASDASNAYHTSIVDPINKEAQHLQDMWQGANNKVAAPALPNITGAPQVGMVGGGGFPGGGGTGAAAPAAIGGFNTISVRTPTAGQPGAAPTNDPFRAQQLAAVSQLQQQANGTGISVAQNQLQQGQQANIAATMAALASQRGQANPLAQRQAMQSMGDTNAQTNQQAATARLQEQLQAQGLLGTMASQGRAGDVATQQTALQGAGLDLQAQQATADNTIKAQQATAQIQQAHDDLLAKYAAMGMDAQKANQQADIQIKSLQQQGVLGIGALQMQSGAAQNQLLGQALGAGGTLAGVAATAMSDKKLKTNIKPGDAKLEKFLLAVGAHEYQYKDAKFGTGRRISPMAQELEKDPTGKAFVSQTPDGKMVDYGKALGTMLSAQGMLMRRIKELEPK